MERDLYFDVQKVERDALSLIQTITKEIDKKPVEFVLGREGETYIPDVEKIQESVEAYFGI